MQDNCICSHIKLNSYLVSALNSYLVSAPNSYLVSAHNSYLVSAHNSYLVSAHKELAKFRICTQFPFSKTKKFRLSSCVPLKFKMISCRRWPFLLSLVFSLTIPTNVHTYISVNIFTQLVIVTNTFRTVDKKC